MAKRRKKVIGRLIRKEVIRRDNCRCRACGLPDIDNLQADHIVPESLGGKIEIDNLQTLCAICNNRKGNACLGELPIMSAINGRMTVNTLMADIATRREAFQKRLDKARG
jgi:5-methylcytosine-specific restriction protein A